MPQDEGRAIRQDGLELAVSDLGIQKIDPGRVDLDQDIVVPQHRFRHVAEPQGALAFVRSTMKAFMIILLQSVAIERIQIFQPHLLAQALVEHLPQARTDEAS